MNQQINLFDDLEPVKKFAGNILVIDSHKASHDGPVENLHWQNSRMIADALGADLIWSYPNVNDYVRGGYDAIIFVHASHYAYTDYAWIEQSPNAKLYYVTNEYNLGEPRTLWMAAKAGRKYTVLANHPHRVSKVVMKYVDDWILLNLNSLVYGNYSFVNQGGKECVYYGSYRDDRKKYFKKYFDGMTVSTHMKNRPKIDALEVNPRYINRLNIQKGDLSKYGFSLYIEDEKTHDAYNYLANRFYESINSGTICLFDESCENTIAQSGYEIDNSFIIRDSADMVAAAHSITEGWSDRIIAQAAEDKRQTIETFKKVIL
jgi:hypothetical protein